MKEDITPWEINTKKLSYSKIITDFGCSEISETTIDLLKKAIAKKHGEKSVEKKINHFLKRKIFFAQRDFDKILEKYINGEEFYIYTGRGPSSESMHLGHSVPFMFCKYLQELFDIFLVIQITDDEKFLCKNISLEEAEKYAKENIKDIISFGFDPKKTFIFSNTQYISKLFTNSLKISKTISLLEVQKVFGFSSSTNIGMIEYPARQIAPCFSSSFDFFDKNTRINCLVPAAIDQDPFFRLARDKANKLKEKKVASVYSEFLPSLLGKDSKMSASIASSTIYLNDTEKEIRKKIKKFAFSGGRETLKEHKEFGGNCEIDISYIYLKYFEEDDEKLMNIKKKYESGELLSGEIKKICEDKIVEFVKNFKENRDKITEEDITTFMNLNKFQ